MATAKKGQNIAPPKFNTNPTLPNLWVDNLNVASREDNVCVLRFFTSLPEGFFEQVRVMTDKQKLKQFINALCAAVDYYPTKKQLTTPMKGDKEPLSH